MAITCTLGSLDISEYIRGEGADLGVAQLDYDIAGGPYVDIALQVNTRTNQPVVCILPMIVTGTSADDIISTLADIRAECAKRTNTLTVGQTGATLTVTTNLLASPQPNIPWDNIYDVGLMARFELTLVREPFFYAAEVTEWNAAPLTLPNALDLSNIKGDYAAPLTITVDNDTGEADIHALWCGLYTNDATYDVASLLVEAEDLSWAANEGTTGPTTYASGGASIKTNETTDEADSSVPTTGMASGSYQVLARVSLEDAGETGTYSIGGCDPVVLDPADTNWHFMELGEVAITAGVTTSLTVTMQSSSATAGKAACLDCLYFLPTSYGVHAWHDRDGESTDEAPVTLDEYGASYSSTYDITNTYGHQLSGFRDQQLIVVAEQADPDDTHYHGLVTVKYTPRYASWR